MEQSLNEKFTYLKKILGEMDSVLVAFSGGVDSSFLLKTAHDVLGNRVLAVTAASPTYPDSELAEAKRIAAQLGILHRIVESNELNIPEFSDNSQNRCYFCKTELFSLLNQIAKKENIKQVVDGCNFDDLADFRPGRKAAKELGIRSPLCESGLKKEEIRELSRKLGLITWNKPAYACLASRFPYGEEINERKLYQVNEAEKAIKMLGIRQVRVRHHEGIARIEIEPADFKFILQPKVRNEVIESLKNFGYSYITLDLQGYRTGSMNEPFCLDTEEKTNTI